MSNSIKNFYYENIKITVTLPGVYYIMSDSNIDTYAYIYYDGRFDPNNSSANVLLENDDNGGNGQFSVVPNFSSPAIINVVVTTYNADTTGAFFSCGNGPILSDHY